MKKTLALILTVCMMMSILAIPVMAKTMPFTDVKKADWFYNDVQGAYDTGLINGKTDTEYKPNDNMTYAEAIKLAACMHQYVEDGKVTLKNGDPWYQTYVNYAKDQGIIEKDYSFNDNASRSGYMEIFANCMELPIINAIEDGSIPDVKATAAYAPAVYKLYRAGILTGVDEEHNCNPFDNIKRSEVAAILTRMMDKDARKEFTMGDPDNAPTEKPEATEAPEVTEKPEATEAPAKELSVSALPEKATVSLNQPVTLKAIVSGGKAPYTYEWQVYSRNAGASTVSAAAVGFGDLTVAAKEKLGGYIALDSDEPVAAGIADVKYEDNAVTFTVEDPKFFTYFSQIRCKVTDANGTEKNANFTLEYAGTGETNELTDSTFLMYIEDIFTIEGRGLVVTGRITSGKVKVGDDLKLLKGDGTVETVKVEGVEMFRKLLDQAEKGDNIGLQISGLGTDPETAKAKVNRGEALTGYNDKLVHVQSMGVTLTMKSKAEGGKSGHTAGDGSYKPQMYLGTRDYTVYLENWVWDEENDTWTQPDIVPGETYEEVEIETAYEGQYFVAYPGQTGEIREGGKTVGTFTVNEVWDSLY